MARIEYIKNRLENWGRWCQQGESGSLGYPRQSSIARLIAPSGCSDAAIPLSSIDASEIDDAVTALRFTQSHLHMVLTLTYAKGLPRHQVAAKMGKADSTISSNLDAADRAIDRWLVDRKAAKEMLGVA
jgi:hypothetical protein